MLLKRKPRPESRLQRLTPQQQDTAFAYCQTTSVRDAVRWLKEQFNLTLSKSSLSRWLQQQRIERSMAAELAELRDNQQGALLITDVAGASTPLTVANSVLFANAVFNEFRKPPAERDENRLVRYMDLALKARDLEIRASAVQLAAERFRFDAARKTPGQPGAGFPARTADHLADESKRLEEATILLFGEPPAGFKSETGLPVAEIGDAPSTHRDEQT
jgi:hypothetical protein